MATQTAERFRLVTRSDFDGLVCAALLRELSMLDDILFVHPKDMQDGKVELTERDITTNLPYVPGVHLAFDHHASEVERISDSPDNHIIVADAQSAARVVFDHFGGRDAFDATRITDEMMDAVDVADSARFSVEEILDPTGWILLSFLMDPRTGLGRFRNFRISNYQLMMQLINACTEMSVQEILQTPDVAERVALYREHAEAATEQLRRCAEVRGNLVVLDLRDEEVIHPTNRFTIYALFPATNISIHVLWGAEAAEHGLRHRQVDRQPQLEDERRRAHARVGRRRPRSGRNLSDRQRGRRAGPRRADGADQRRRLTVAVMALPGRSPSHERPHHHGAGPGQRAPTHAPAKPQGPRHRREAGTRSWTSATASSRTTSGLYEQGDTSWGAYSPDLPGVAVVGDTREEVETLMRKAIPLHLDALREAGFSLP